MNLLDTLLLCKETLDEMLRATSHDQQQAVADFVNDLSIAKAFVMQALETGCPEMARHALTKTEALLSANEGSGEDPLASTIEQMLPLL